jgi:NADPH:quinone reductase-like Zn-dependent oxidoreductase
VANETELLVRIYATTVNSADVRLRKADPWLVRAFLGWRKPRIHILGTAFSGRVESIGSKVTRFKPGDEVFGTTAFKLKAYAEYKTFAETDPIALKPSNLSHEEAAVLPFGGTTALWFLRKAHIQPGQRVLVYGASGAVGTAAVQLARHFGATVTAVCSGTNATLVKSLGAEDVIDYTKEDFTRRSQQYDVIFETVGKYPFRKCLKALTKRGTLILGSSMLEGIAWAGMVNLIGKKKVIAGTLKETPEGVQFLADLASKNIFKPVIDRIYPFEQMADAHRYTDSGHKKGNVAITLS